MLRLLAALAALLAALAADASAQMIGRARYFTRGWPLVGESSTVVESMAIDSLGYLHLATGAGLLRFDGRRVWKKAPSPRPP